MIITSIFSSSLFCETDGLLNRILDAKLHVLVFENPSDSVNYLNDFRKTLEADGSLVYDDSELMLTADNLLAQEQMLRLSEAKTPADELKSFILNQYEKNENFEKNHEGQLLSCDYAVSAWEIKNSAMGFLSMSEMIKLAMKQKSDYEVLLAENPQHARGLMNSAFWYYFAPGIAGGSKTIAKNNFQNAIKYASCDYEMFYSRLYYSQILFKDGKKADAAKLLEECEQILSGTAYIAFVRKMNENGWSIFDYVNNKDKIDKKLGI